MKMKTKKIPVHYEVLGQNDEMIIIRDRDLSSSTRTAALP